MPMMLSPCAISPCNIRGGGETIASFSELYFDNVSLRYQEITGVEATTPANSNDDPVGTIVDESPNDLYITAPSNGERPLYKTANTSLYYDLSDDILQFTLSSEITNGQMFIQTPHGWYRTGVGRWTATTHYLREADPQKVILIDTDAVSAGQLAQLVASMTGTEYTAIWRTNDTTLYNRLDNGGTANHSISYIGNNAATYSKDSSDSGDTVDVAAQGLTTPIIMRLPIEVKTDTNLTQFRFNGNGLTGSSPDLASNTALTVLMLYSNNLTGIFPNLSSNTALISVSYNDNALTNAFPDLSSNTAFVNIYCSNNNLVESVPDVSLNTSLTLLQLHSNSLTGSNITSVAAVLLTVRLENNALSEVAVNGILVALDTAGGAAGTCDLSGGTNAAPTGAGATAKTSLGGKGWSVNTN